MEKKKKTSGEVGGGERAGKAEERTSGREERAAWGSLQGPCQTANLAWRETLMCLLFFKGGGPRTGRWVEIHLESSRES